MDEPLDVKTQKAFDELQTLSDDTLSRVSFAMPWQYEPSEGNRRDPDGFRESASKIKGDVLLKREELQTECWDKFHKNPQVNTSVRGTVGRLTGWGFAFSSEIPEIQDVIDETELDWRNRLWVFWPKYIARSIIEGELFIIFTVHPDGFVEVDFMDPSVLDDSKGDGGILFHPSKTVMPLIYCVKDDDGNEEQFPSIFLARYPELKELAAKNKDYEGKLLANSKDRKKKYAEIGGFKRFIISWDRGFITRRTISHLRTTLEWLNHYENLKLYEIDHKKSAGAYLWVVTIEDMKSFRLWLALSDEDKRKTGIMAKKTPGSTLILPPGMKMEARNPQLPKISDSDTDILHMITGGLNEPEDVSTGQAKGTFASVKASRGPMSDRISDEIAYFDRFVRYDFWGSVFFLRSAVTDFPTFFKVKEAYTFKNQKPVFRDVKRPPERLIEVTYPTSEVTDFDARAKGLLGVKHGSVYDVLGIPHSEIAKKMGIGNYNLMRLRSATEEEKYPELIANIDAESMQEQTEAEPKKAKRPERPKTSYD